MANVMPDQAVIVLGVDTPIGLALLRDLGRHGYRTIGLGRTRHAIGGVSRYCDTFFVREQDEAGLVAQITALASDPGAGFLIAISEADLLMINRHRRSLERVLVPLTPAQEQLANVIDKVRCQEFAHAAGIRTAAILQPASMPELQAGLEDLAFPVILKWSDPNAVAADLARAGLPLHKIEYAQDRDTLLQRMSPYTVIGRFPMVQAYCPGTGLGQMFLARDGEVLLEFQHERLHEWPPEGGFSTLCRSVPLDRHASLRARSRALLKALNWTGVAMIEYRYDAETGDYCFMEINGRFWGSLPLAISAGVPFAAALVAVCGQNLPAPEYRTPYPRITSCFLIPEVRRLARILFQRSRIADPCFQVSRMAALGSFLGHVLNPFTRYFVFSVSDPRPFLRDMANVLRKLFSVPPR